MIRLLSTLMLLLSALPVAAHKASDAYLNLSVDGSVVNGRWDIALLDLALIMPLDPNDDRQITWGELRGQQTELFAYLSGDLAIATAGQACPLSFHQIQVTHHSDGAYAVFTFSAKCPRAPAQIDIDYRFLFERDARHKGLLYLEQPASSVIFSAENRLQTLSLEKTNPWQTAQDYFLEGIWHIWIGYDHLLFLTTLLLPATFMRRNGRWHRRALRPSLFEAFKIVTAFTAAHTLTLSLAVLGNLQFSTPWVEVMIAASIALVAVHNLFPRWQRQLWLLTFVFGLVHGLGFASVLGALGLPPDEKLLPLLSFNLGVEAGQLMVVSAVLPVLFLLSGVRIYTKLVLQGGSAMIVAIAVVWIIERLAFIA